MGRSARRRRDQATPPGPSLAHPGRIRAGDRGRRGSGPPRPHRPDSPFVTGSLERTPRWAPGRVRVPSPPPPLPGRARGPRRHSPAPGAPAPGPGLRHQRSSARAGSRLTAQRCRFTHSTERSGSAAPIAPVTRRRRLLGRARRRADAEGRGTVSGPRSPGGCGGGGGARGERAGRAGRAALRHPVRRADAGDAEGAGGGWGERGRGRGRGARGARRAEGGGLGRER